MRAMFRFATTKVFLNAHQARPTTGSCDAATGKVDRVIRARPPHGARPAHHGMAREGEEHVIEGGSQDRQVVEKDPGASEVGNHVRQASGPVGKRRSDGPPAPVHLDRARAVPHENVLGRPEI